MRKRFWIEIVLGSLSAFLLAVTLLWKDWIERMFGVDPDQGSGSLEWGIVFVLVACTLLFGALAWTESRARSAETG